MATDTPRPVVLFSRAQHELAPGALSPPLQNSTSVVAGIRMPPAGIKIFFHEIPGIFPTPEERATYAAQHINWAQEQVWKEQEKNPTRPTMRGPPIGYEECLEVFRNLDGQRRMNDPLLYITILRGLTKDPQGSNGQSNSFVDIWRDFLKRAPKNHFKPENLHLIEELTRAVTKYALSFTQLSARSGVPVDYLKRLVASPALARDCWNGSEPRPPFKKLAAWLGVAPDTLCPMPVAKPAPEPKNKKNGHANGVSALPVSNGFHAAAKQVEAAPIILETSSFVWEGAGVPSAVAARFDKNFATPGALLGVVLNDYAENHRPTLRPMLEDALRAPEKAVRADGLLSYPHALLMHKAMPDFLDDPSMAPQRFAAFWGLEPLRPAAATSLRQILGVKILSASLGRGTAIDYWHFVGAASGGKNKPKLALPLFDHLMRALDNAQVNGNTYRDGEFTPVLSKVVAATGTSLPALLGPLKDGARMLKALDPQPR